MTFSSHYVPRRELQFYVSFLKQIWYEILKSHHTVAGREHCGSTRGHAPIGGRMADEVKLEWKKLLNCIKAMKEGFPSVKVGILGDNAARQEGELNNAEIGFTNEFGKMTGYPKIPARSFLRMPLKTRLNNYICRFRCHPAAGRV